MTTEYHSKESALEMGLYYAGFGDSKLRQKVMKDLPKPVETEIGWPQNKTIETYLVTTPTGLEVKIGVGRFREGFDLWLINPDTGKCQRT